MKEATREVIRLREALKEAKATEKEKRAARKKELAFLKGGCDELLKSTRAIARKEASKCAEVVGRATDLLEKAEHRLTMLRYQELKEPLRTEPPGRLVIRLLDDWADNKIMRSGVNLQAIRNMISKGRLVSREGNTQVYHVPV